MNRFDTIDTPVEYEGLAALSKDDRFNASYLPINANTDYRLSPFDTPNWNEDTFGPRDTPSLLPEEVGEMATAETTELVGAEVTETLLGSIADPASAAVGAIGIGIDIAEDQSTTNQAIQNYQNAMTTGHGLGFSNVADTNLKETQSNVQAHQAMTLGLTSLMGPFGAFIASMFPAQQANSNTYDAATTGGTMINAQSATNADTSSDLTEYDANQ